MGMSSIFDIAGSGMSAQTVRLNTVASNIANAESVSSSIEDTYRARKPLFQVLHQQYLAMGGVDPMGNTGMGGTGEGQGVRVAGIVESQAPLQKRFQPDHPAADESGYVMYPNVNVVEEMADMISASRSFQINVDIMNSAKQMMQRVLTLGQ